MASSHLYSTVDSAGNSALHRAMNASCLDLEHIDFLLESGVDPNLANFEGRSPLHVLFSDSQLRRCSLSPEDRAFQKKQEKKVLKKFCAHGFDINRPDSVGNTLLHLAVAYLRLDLVEAVLKSGAAVDIQNHQAATPLMAVLPHALGNCLYLEVRIQVMQSLLKAGASPESLKSRMGIFLHDFLNNDVSPPILNKGVQRLLAHGADLEITDSAQRTSLLLAAHVGDWKSMEKLLQHGASLHAKDWKGQSVLHHIAQHPETQKSIALFKKVLGMGGHPEPNPDVTQTVLYAAITNDAPSLIPLLLPYYEDLTPYLVFVRAQGNTKVGELLQKEVVRREHAHLQNIDGNAPSSLPKRFHRL